MAKRYQTHQSLGKAIQGFIKEHKLQKGIDRVVAREVWTSVMGPGVNHYTTAVELRNSTLFVSLSSSVLREELSLGTSKIKLMLNEALGRELVAKLVLR